MRITLRYCKHNNLTITVRFYFLIYFIVRTLFFLSSSLLYFSLLSLFLCSVTIRRSLRSALPFITKRWVTAITGPQALDRTPAAHVTTSPCLRGTQRSSRYDFGVSESRKLLPHQVAVGYRHSPPACPGGKLARAPFTNSPSPRPVERFLSPTVTSIRFISS